MEQKKKQEKKEAVVEQNIRRVEGRKRATAMVDDGNCHLLGSSLVRDGLGIKMYRRTNLSSTVML